MTSSNNRLRSGRDALIDEVARFQSEVRRLALAIAREVVQQELERKLARRKPARPASAPVPPARPAPAEIAAAPVPTPAGETAPAMPSGAPEEAPPPAVSRKREPWTRETIVSELANWMSSGTEIDAAFVTRYGPPGLVAAARRVFGRFDAAMNVAALHLSNLYPDGPPPKPGRPVPMHRQRYAGSKAG